MSKAFTRESDDLPVHPLLTRPVSTLPPGAKNYLTASDERRLQEELSRLVEIDRPRLAASAEASDKQRLGTLDQRIRDIQQCLLSAEVVPPPDEPEDRVTFGATVAVRDEGGEELTYRIVGVGETDSDRGWVSWLSPIAKALLNARLGERVSFKVPSGEKQLEIVGIAYE